MSKTTINIGYDGLAVEAGSMDVQELAPALLAIGELLQQANHVLNKDKTKIAVNVKSDFKQGSFEIILEVIQSLSEQIQIALSSEESYSAKKIAEFIGVSAGSAVSVIALIKWLHGRKIDRITTIENDDFKIETMGDYDSIEVSKETINLYRNKVVRKNIKDALKPLLQKGIDIFQVKEDGVNVEEVNKSEEQYFAVPETPDEEILEVTTKGAFNIIGVFFEEGLKWRLYDGENQINALMKDKDFLEELDKGHVSFTKGDILEVKIKTKQWNTEKGLKKEHEILKVIRQIKASEQIPLPFESE